MARRIIVFAVALALATVPVRAAGTLAPWPKPQFLTANGDPCASCKLFTYTAGTTTKLATYSDVNLLSANTNPIVLDSAGRTSAIFLSPSTSYKFVLAPSTDSDPPVSPLWTQDNIANVPPNFLNVDVVGTAGQLLSLGQLVYLSDGQGGRSAGSWYRASATNAYSSTTAYALGLVVDNSIGSGNAGTIRLSGRMTGFSGLTTGALHYIHTTDGFLTATPPANARAVGVAESGSVFVLQQWVPPPDASLTIAGLVSTGAQSFAGVKILDEHPLFSPGTSIGFNALVSGRLSTNITAVGNVGAGEDDLMTYSLPANVLDTDGKILRVTAWGTYANNANLKTVRGYFGATKIAEVAHSTAAANLSWKAELLIVRTGPTTQDAHGEIRANSRTAVIVQSSWFLFPGETLSGAVTVKFTGEATSNNDVIQEGMIIEVVG